MNGRTAKALRKVFNAKENPQGFKEYKRALRNSGADIHKKSAQMARDIAKSGKTIHHRVIPNE